MEGLESGMQLVRAEVGNRGVTKGAYCAGILPLRSKSHRASYAQGLRVAGRAPRPALHAFPVITGAKG